MAKMPIQTAHPELFHYTDLQGLRGILSSNTLWATNYRYLNDRSELTLFRQKIKLRLIRVAKDVMTSLFLDEAIHIGAFSLSVELIIPL
jgi:hypothetical protein